MAKKDAPRIFIASPTAGSVKPPFMKSVLGMMIELLHGGIACSFETEEGSDIPLQRNLLARSFRQSPGFTHMMCLDSDMAFPPELGRKLLGADKPITGAICTSRSFD